MSGSGPRRRSVLRGAGVAIALPALASAVAPRRARAEPAAPARARFVCYFTPNGHPPGAFWPPEDDRTLVLSSILKPLTGVRDELLPVSGLALRSAGTTGHAGVGALLTGTRPGQGMSLDQHLARAPGNDARLRSLELAVLPTAPARPLPWPHLSYAAARRAIVPEGDPGEVFRRLFAAEMDRRALDRLLARRRSTLDLARESTQGLLRRLGAADRPTLEQHLESIRAVERILPVMVPGIARCGRAYAPPSVAPDDVAEATRLRDAQIDLLLVALACGDTRVATLVVGGADAPLRFPELGLGVAGGPTWSALSDRRDPEAQAAHARISRFCAEGLARLLEGLRAREDGGERLLARTIVLWATECNPDHSHERVPFLLAGGRALGLRPGRYVRLRQARPHNDLLVSILRAMGSDEGRFGDPRYVTGPITELG